MIGSSMGFRPEPARKRKSILELFFWGAFITAGSAGLLLLAIDWLGALTH